MKIVKIIVNDDGDPTDDPSWHWVDEGNRQGNAAFCTQEFFGFGESQCEYETSDGEITCPECLKKLRLYKKVATRAGL